jgi:alpha-1,3-glucan synthase
MMEKYPRRVYSKPEFTALPPFIFTGAEFALIPSRDEPFGLVAVEFGRKGALGVGARVGGLGQMPGWWFTVESTTTKHMLHQFKSAIEDALSSDTEQRAMMRARSAKQRFPVAKWVEDLNTLQQAAIKIHTEEKNSHSKGIFRPRTRSQAPASTSGLGVQLPDEAFFNPQSRAISSDRLSTYEAISIGEGDPPPTTGEHHTTLQRGLSLGVRSGPGHHPRASLAPEPLARVLEQGPPPRTPEIYEIDPDGALTSREGSLHNQEMLLSREQAEAHFRESENQLALDIREGSTTDASGRPLEFIDTAYGSPRGRGRSRSEHLDRDEDSPSRSPSGSHLLDPISLPMRIGSSHHRRKPSSALDLSTIKNASMTDFSLQKVDPTFEDKNGVYYARFESMLDNLSAKTSEHDLCVEEFLVQSEKAWFKKMRAERLGRGDRARSRDGRLSPAPSLGWPRESMHSSRASSIAPYEPTQTVDGDHDSDRPSEEADEFLLGANYQRPSLFKRWMQTRVGDWPIYSFLLALGQIMAANSYQITLLTGPQGQGGAKLYIVGTVFIIMSCLWWVAFRTLPSKVVLSAPFAFYGLAFLFVGVAPFAKFGSPRNGIQNVATGFYVAASASGSIFFALNFGDEGKFVPQIYWYLRSY